MYQKKVVRRTFKQFISSELFFGISMALTLSGTFYLLGWLMLEVFP